MPGQPTPIAPSENSIVGSNYDIAAQYIAKSKKPGAPLPLPGRRPSPGWVHGIVQLDSGMRLNFRTVVLSVKAELEDQLNE